MKVGTGQKNAEGHLEFELSFPLLPSFKLILKPLTKPQNSESNFPDFAAYIGRQECGAFWVKHTKRTGMRYLGGQLDSPAFPGGRIYVRIFNAREDDRKGQMDALWDPERESKEPEPTQPQQPAPSSSATEADDDIPF